MTITHLSTAFNDYLNNYNNINISITLIDRSHKHLKKYLVSHSVKFRIY